MGKAFEGSTNIFHRRVSLYLVPVTAYSTSPAPTLQETLEVPENKLDFS